MAVSLVKRPKVSLVKLPLFCDFIGADHSGATVRVMWDASPTVVCVHHVAALSN